MGGAPARHVAAGGADRDGAHARRLAVGQREGDVLAELPFGHQAHLRGRGEDRGAQRGGRGVAGRARIHISEPTRPY